MPLEQIEWSVFKELQKENRALKARIRELEARQVRPEIALFAQIMEARMAHHDDDWGDLWRQTPVPDILKQIEYAMNELQIARLGNSEERSGEIDMEIRPEIMAFARLMEQKMRKHDADWGASWKEMQRHDVLGVLYAETRELISALLRLPCQRPEEVDEEAADVANAAMFCAWNQGGLYHSALEMGKESDAWGNR